MIGAFTDSLAAAARATLVRTPQARHLPPCLAVKTTCAVRLERNLATLTVLLLMNVP